MQMGTCYICNGIPGLSGSCQHLYGDVRGSGTELSAEQTKIVEEICRLHVLHNGEEIHEGLLTHLNSLRPSIQFTMETEENTT